MSSMRALFLALVMAGFLPAQANAFFFWWHKSPACEADSTGSGTVDIVDSLTGAFWTFQVDYEVFADNNCANPEVVPGNFTYVYTVSMTAEGAVPIELAEFRIELTDANYVSEAGYISGGPGVVPESVDIVPDPANHVAASFTPGSFALGDTSLPIYATSPYRPGDGTLNIQTNLFSGTGTALVPSELPEPCPCGPFFWKNLAFGWWWVHHYFSDAQFDQIKARAVELSGGYFEDENDLIGTFFCWGFLNVKKRAERELAAVLLNMAAGELFPGNTKCRLFPGTELDLDGDGTADSTVDEAIGSIITGIEGDLCQQYEAYHLASDINTGRVVIGAVTFH